MPAEISLLWAADTADSSEACSAAKQTAHSLHQTNELKGAIMMDDNPADQVLDELFSALELAETQSGALLQFLKDKNLATDEDLVPYLEQAGNTSNVRWRAARLRINSLLAAAVRKTEEELTEKVYAAVQNNQKQQREHDREQTQEQTKNRKEITTHEKAAENQKVSDTEQPPVKPDGTEARKQTAAGTSPLPEATEKPVEKQERTQPKSKQDGPDQKVA